MALNYTFNICLLSLERIYEILTSPKVDIEVVDYDFFSGKKNY